MSQLKQPNFINAEIESEQHPEQFKIVKSRRSLRSGDLVNLECAGEALIVGIYRVLRGAYYGKVIFRPHLTDDHGLEGGDRLKFAPAHVCRAERDGHWLP